MGKTAVTGYEARGDTYSMDPEKLKLITDRADTFYEDRVELPMDSPQMLWLIESMKEHAADPLNRNVGNSCEVLIRKNGKNSDGTDCYEVVDGRQRVKAARAINREYRDAGRDPILVKCTYKSITSEKSFMASVVTRNNCRVANPPSVDAIHVAKMVEAGSTWEEIQRAFARPMAELKPLLPIAGLCEEVRAAVDSGAISVSAAGKMKDMTIQSQRAAVKELVRSGEKITAKKAAQKAASAPCADGGIPAPKKPKCKSRAQIEEALGRLVADVGYGGNEDKRSGMIVSLQWVLGEMEIA